MTETSHNTHNQGGWLAGLLKFGVPVIISVGLCWLLFRDFDFREIGRAHV